MKKILFILPCVPYPLTAGGNQAFFNMVEYIRHKMSVSLLLSPGNKEMNDVESLRALWTNVDFYLFREEDAEPKTRCPRYYRWLKKMSESISRKMQRQLYSFQQEHPYKNMTLKNSCFKPFPKAYVEYVSDISRRGFDIIQVEFYPLITLGFLLPKDVQTVFVHHELRYIRNENEMECLTHVTDEDKMLYGIAKDMEKAALRQYKHVIALTDIDRLLLADLVGQECNIYVSPAVVQIESVYDRIVKPASVRLTFVGSENHYPNQDAVDWFCHEVAPCLRAQGFKFVFQVIGTWKSRYVKSLQAVCPEMELVGYVEDLQEYLNGSIVLVPIRIGSGMRMKILDAVSSMASFVTTTKGVEGIDLRHNEECLIADSATDFAAAVIRLEADKKLQVRLATQALKRLRELYNPQEMLERRLAVYDEILQNNTN